MTHLGYVLGGYLLTVAVLGVYVLRLWSRSRALARLAGRSAGWPAAGGTPVPAGPPSPAGDQTG